MMHDLLILWEKTARTLVLAMRSLWLHKLRSVLSVLGIIIGTAAVIALMAFGEGSMRDALEDIKRQGATSIIVRSVKPPEEGGGGGASRKAWVVQFGLTREDQKFLEGINLVTASVPMRIFPQEIRRLHYMKTGRVVATTEDYMKVNPFELAMGRFLVGSDEMTDADEDDNSRMRNVAVIGSEIADSLFPYESPLEKTIVIKGQQFVVVGVAKERMPTGNAGGSTSAEEFNRDVYIPLRTSRGRIGEKVYIRTAGSRSGEQVYLNQITLKINEMENVEETGKAIRAWLKARHEKQDWAVTIPLDRLREAERARDRYKMLLVLIASISLVVGGIGIMNIMLATVTERTREIGIRRALGAKRRDIVYQFMIEAIAQTTLGGVLGVTLGLAIVFVVPWAAETFFAVNLPASLHKLSIVLSLAVSVGVGVLFGSYPAMRAADLDPIEALRHE
jgi:putative ABC transport system permease protein